MTLGAILTYVMLLIGDVIVARLDDNFINWYFPEEFPPNTLIGDLVTEHQLDRRYNRTVLESLRFSFLIQPEPDRRFFAVEETTGLVRSVQVVDRERICPRMEECIVKFDVAVKPIQFFEIIKVEVEIMDTNDNAPAFPEERLVHQMSEASETGSGFVVPAPRDMDSSKNGIRSYEIVPAQGHFELRRRNTIDGETDLRLVLVRKLDREVKDRHRVTVYAVDGGDPRLTGSIVIDLIIIDANDNNPEFDNASYEISVREDIPVGTSLLQVRATDRDIGKNGQVVYDFSKHTAHEYGSLFTVERDTGRIFLQRELDFEAAGIHLLSVTASDQGQDSLPSHASVVVRVEDVNDNAPGINVHTLTGDGEAATVVESADPGEFVAHVSVLDPDSGENGRSTCSIDDDVFDLQRMFSTEFKLVTASRLDRETKDGYRVTITCYDHGETSLTSAATLRIEVTDENDHDPRFEFDSVSFQVLENNAPGQELGKVKAFDLDQGINRDIVYKLNDTVKHLLDINETTGIITAKVALDREKMENVVFDVFAEDKGRPSRSSSIQVSLKILDEDDERPGFVQNQFLFSVMENQPSGTKVGTVEAVDRDAAPFDRFYYYLEPKKDITHLFDIDGVSGLISTKEPLDREARPLYTFTVGVRPVTDHRYSGTAKVIVHVTDVNDNKPRFRYPSSRNETVAVSNMAPVGHSVAQVKAVDPDSGSNANLTYFLSKGNVRNLFSLDPTSGIVKVNADLVSIEHEEFLLLVVAQDSGLLPLSNVAEFRILVSASIPHPTTVDRHYGSILANENMAVMLAIILAAILVAIAVIMVVIVVVRKEEKRKNGNKKNKNKNNKEEEHGRKFDWKQPPAEKVTCQHLTIGEGDVKAGGKERSTTAEEGERREGQGEGEGEGEGLTGNFDLSVQEAGGGGGGGELPLVSRNSFNLRREDTWKEKRPELNKVRRQRTTTF